MGIRFINTHKNLRAWTEAEDDIIRHNYPSKGNLISELLPGRSVCAIRQRVVKIMNQKSENLVSQGGVTRKIIFYVNIIQ